MNKQKMTGILALLGGTVIWGFAFTAQSVGMDYIGPFTFQFIRCLLAAAFLFPLSFLLEHRLGLRHSWRLWKSKALWRSGALCGCVLFAATSLQQFGLLTVDAGKSGFLTAMYIVLVPLLGLFRGQRPGVSAFLGVMLAVAGLYLLSWTGSTGIGAGDLCLIGCALAFAIQIRCIGKYASDLDGVRLNCVQSLTVAILSIPGILLSETVDFSNILACWGPLVFAGVFSMGVAYSFQILGQKHLDATPAALIMSLESVFAALGGWWLLDERMTPRELLGCGLVFAAVILSQLPLPKISK